MSITAQKMRKAKVRRLKFSLGPTIGGSPLYPMKFALILRFGTGKNVRYIRGSVISEVHCILKIESHWRQRRQRKVDMIMLFVRRLSPSQWCVCRSSIRRFVPSVRRFAFTFYRRCLRSLVTFGLESARCIATAASSSVKIHWTVIHSVKYYELIRSN